MGVKVREKPKGSGVYWVFINHHGKRKAKKIGKNRKLALDVAKKIKAKLILGDLDIAKDERTTPTFKELCNQWLELHVKPSKRATTYNRYKSVNRMYINKPVGNVPIDEFRRAEVLTVLRAMHRKGLSRSSLESARNVMSGVCEFAIDYEHIGYNPCAGVMKRMGLQRKMDRKPISIFTKDEVATVLDTCKRVRPDYYPLFLTAFRTGMRLGEILALEWKNVNWQSQYVVVEKSFRNGQLTGTKTGRARNVEMSDQLFSVLKSLHRQRKKEALKNGTGDIEPIIFHTKGGYRSQNTVRNIWRRILDKAGIDYRKLHTTRHTFASLLIADGNSPAYIKDAMGHGSIQITVDVYGHLLPSDSKGAVNSLDDATIRNLSATSQNRKAVTS